MIPFSVCEESPGLIFFYELFKHWVKMFNGIFFGVFEVKRMNPFVNGVVNTEFYSCAFHCVFKFEAKVSVGTDVH